MVKIENLRESLNTVNIERDNFKKNKGFREYKLLRGEQIKKFRREV